MFRTISGNIKDVFPNLQFFQFTPASCSCIIEIKTDLYVKRPANFIKLLRCYIFIKNNAKQLINTD